MRSKNGGYGSHGTTDIRVSRPEGQRDGGNRTHFFEINEFGLLMDVIIQKKNKYEYEHKMKPDQQT